MEVRVKSFDPLKRKKKNGFHKLHFLALEVSRRNVPQVDTRCELKLHLTAKKMKTIIDAENITRDALKEN